MLNNISYRFISEQQMQVVQYRAHQLFLQLKEEQKWDHYCQKYNTQNIHDVTTKRQVEELQEHCREVGVQVESSHQTNKVPSVQQNTSVTRAVPKVQMVSKITKKSPVVDGISDDLKFIKEKLNSLQSGLHELQKTPVASSNMHFTEGRYSNRVLNPVNREQFLHNSLKSSLACIAEKKEKECSEQNKKEDLSCSEKKKSVAFQLPYVLKEERELARRRICGWSQSSLTSKKTVPKKPFYPVTSKAMSKFPKERSSFTKKSVVSKTECTQRVNDIDGVVDEVVDDLLKDSVPIIERVQRLKEQHIKKNVEALAKKLNEIEDAEKLIHEKWQTQNTAVMATTASHPTKSKLVVARRSNTTSSPASEEEISNNATVHGETNSNVEQRRNTNQGALGERNALLIRSDVLRNIFEYKRQFAQYLQQTVPKKPGGLTPWISNSQIADSIFDDCLQDIGTELQNIPEAIIVDMYNNEFVLYV